MPAGRPRTLSRERVVQTGLAVVAEHGLEATSMREIARRLGINETSLYTYVASKDDLHAAMVEAAFTEDLPLPAEDDPRPPGEQLKVVFRELRQRAVNHRELLGLLGRVSVASTVPLAASERVAALLARIGLAPQQQALMHLLLTSVTITSGLTAAGGDPARGASGPAAPFEADRYPALAALGEAAASVIPPTGAFEVVLDFLLDEIAPALAERAS